ncbi:MAG: hypothetical protein SFX18_16845 [Pirellulales bacterium]|nr:hypothetical protein [Pirellulales bacterium]
MDHSSYQVGVLINLPEELHYLIAPVLGCNCRSENEIFAYLDQITAEQLEEHAVIAERVLWNNHYDLVNQFLDEFCMSQYPECAKLYFYFGLLDHADLKFDSM